MLWVYPCLVSLISIPFSFIAPFAVNHQMSNIIPEPEPAPKQRVLFTGAAVIHYAHLCKETIFNFSIQCRTLLVLVKVYSPKYWLEKELNVFDKCRLTNFSIQFMIQFNTRRSRALLLSTNCQQGIKLLDCWAQVMAKLPARHYPISRCANSQFEIINFLLNCLIKALRLIYC